LTNVKYVSREGGARSLDPQKFYKNVALLEEGLKKEPNNARYAFYLAESYHDAGEKGKSLECYQKRIDMGGWAEEVFWSYYRIGCLMQAMNLPANLVIEAFNNAHAYRPHRPEPVYHLAELYNNKGNYQKAYETIKQYEALDKPLQKDYLFNVDWMPDFCFGFQRSIAAYYLGHYQESLDICDRLLKNENLPESWVELVKNNRQYPLEKLTQNQEAIAKKV
jgi:tetratricopeptide (TPR) repeat protein